MSVAKACSGTAARKARASRLAIKWASLLLLLPGVGRAGTIKGKVIVRGARDNGDAVIYIEKTPNRTFPAPKEPLILDQINLTFTPHILPVLVGTTVSFPNSDEVRHNVFSPSPPKRFNLGTYPRGVTRTVTFDKPGEVALLCNVHAEMSAYVIVVESPYFAVTTKDGSYTIKNVPPGKYVLKAWHERLKSQTKEIEVRGDAPVTVDFELSR